MNPKVSIIIPVYNTDIDLFKSCIKSVLDQTYSNIETIIVDDGSKKELAQAYKDMVKDRKGSSIEIYRKRNGGVSSARNYGIQKATGKYLLFLDSDDSLVNEAIQVLVLKALDTEKDIVFSGRIITSIDGKEDIIEKTVYDNDVIPRNIIRNSSNYALHGVLFTKNIIDKVQFDEQIKIAEDTIFILDCIKLGARITSVGKPLCIYRIHDDSALRKKDAGFITDYIEGINVLFGKMEQQFTGYNGLIKKEITIKYYTAVKKVVRYIEKKEARDRLLKPILKDKIYFGINMPVLLKGLIIKMIMSKRMHLSEMARVVLR